ncbi:MAG: adenosyl-hopene transferase HpnH [Bryobacterales bacterium]|nr:adenosyl-hopene transferase HpnH [Bryobacterales bacterium]
MKLPLSSTLRMGAYVAKNTLFPPPEWQRDPQSNKDPFPILQPTTNPVGGGVPHPMLRKRFPLVLMLEPLHACNLTCTGCGRIREYEDTITSRVSLGDCLGAMDECRAPVVSICGGEPLMYKPVAKLVQGALQRKRHIYLCTNGMFLPSRLHEFQPDKRFFFNIHLDGLRDSHDLAVERTGVFEEAVAGLRAAKAAGHMVCTNTTVYRETDMDEIRELFSYLRQFDVDGHMLSPAYGYSAVGTREIFLTREEIHEKFRHVDDLFRKFRMNTTPTYVEFLKGNRDLPCTAWGNPTYNTEGWKGPCYLITDAHWNSFEELMNETPWERYGRGNDERCEHCMVHCGYEPSAALGVNARLGDSLRMIRWALS